MYRVFRVPPAHASRIEALLKDDLVSRQSVLVRDARSLGVEGEGTIVLVEGSAAALARADNLLEGAGIRLPEKEADAAYMRFKSQDEDAASGMGLLFGP